MEKLKCRFLCELRKIYDAEQRIAIALPKMNKPGISNQLKHQLSSLTEDTKSHLENMGNIFECFARTAQGMADEAAGQGIADLTFADANHPALISALHMTGQYEIASYSSPVDWEAVSYASLLDWASQLGNAASADFLDEVLALEDREQLEPAELRDTIGLCSQRGGQSPPATRRAGWSGKSDPGALAQ